jgi:hypothetical protein
MESSITARVAGTRPRGANLTIGSLRDYDDLSLMRLTFVAFPVSLVRVATACREE